VNGGLRRLLVGARPDDTEKKVKVEHIEMKDEGRRLRKRERRQYDVDGDDEQYFKKIENGSIVTGSRPRAVDKSATELGQEYAYKAKRAFNPVPYDWCRTDRELCII